MESPQVSSSSRDAQYVSTLESLLALPATNTQSALNQASQLVAEALAADKVDVFVYEPAIDTLVAIGTSDTPMGRRERQLGLDRLARANGGSAVQVFDTGVSYITGHAERDPHELKGITKALGVRSILSVPLDVDGARRGVVQVDAGKPDKFSDGDLVFLQAVARWIGMVLHRAELVERISRDSASQARRVAADELITILAHDLRGPLTPIRGYLTMIRQETERAGLASSARYAAASQRAVSRLLGMIDNLLDTARLDQDIFVLNREILDVARLARETAGVFDTPDVPVEVRGSDEVLIEADPERIRQALENLLSNARKHSPAGAKIVVEIGQESRERHVWAVLTVRDAGPGVAPELLPNLFTRFAGGKATQGLGLGLYLARGIAEAHGGTLTLDSTPGSGATFRLALPGMCDTSIT